MLAELLAKMLARLPVVILGTSKNVDHVISEKNACYWTTEYEMRVPGEQVKLTAQICRISHIYSKNP